MVAVDMKKPQENKGTARLSQYLTHDENQKSFSTILSSFRVDMEPFGWYLQEKDYIKWVAQLNRFKQSKGAGQKS